MRIILQILGILVVYSLRLLSIHILTVEHVVGDSFSSRSHILTVEHVVGDSFSSRSHILTVEHILVGDSFSSRSHILTVEHNWWVIASHQGLIF